MAVPRNRLSKSRTGKHRAHHAKKPTNTVKCKNCGATKLPHRICPSCGFYRGRALVSAAP
jgi:large subunit ribosomal protein L32